MAWNAKRTGYYLPTDAEGRANILEMNGYLNGEGFALEAQAALIACSLHEGGLNPWRWGDDQSTTITDPTKGYGLFQFTPPDKYINSTNAGRLLGYSPNLNTSVQTPTATANDGYAQMQYFYLYADWVDIIWRFSAWDPADYPVEYAAYQHCVSTWGTNDTLSKTQYKSITNISDAVIAFIGGYEGPADPSFYYSDAVSDATNVIYPILSGDTPPTPPTPTPTGRRRSMPLWMYLKRY